MRRTFNLIIALMFCLSISGCKKAPPNLVSFAAEVKTITVYDLEGLTGPKYSQRDLNNAFQAPLAPALFRELAAYAKFKDASALWKGSSLAIVEMKDGSQKQLAFSYYGSFFKIIGQDGFFYFEDEARKKWNEAYGKKIIQEDFIPKRIERNKRMQERMP